MRKHAMIVTLTAVLALCSAFSASAAPCWEELGIKPLNILRWTPGEQLCGYQNMENLWSSGTVSKGAGPSVPLPYGRSPAPLPDVAAFSRKNNVSGLLIIHNGRIVHEMYANGFADTKRWTSFSMAKSLTSILAGAAVADGHIKSLDDKVARYLPELAKGAYADVTVRQILTMTSGAAWNENYRDPESDVAKLADIVDSDEAVLLRYMANRKRAAKPGAVFNYSTGEAGIIGHLVRRATGRSLAAYMSEKVWSRLGMERDAIWITDKTGAEVSGCCFSATLRDYGRIGLFMLNRGRIGTAAVLPSWWVDEASRASAPSRKQGRPYGYQWWVRENGAYQASGIFGQLIHVDPTESVVIVMLGAWPTATGTSELHEDRREFIAAVKKALRDPPDTGKAKRTR